MDFKVSFPQLFAYYNLVIIFRWFWYWFNVWVWSTPENVTRKWCQNVAVIITNFDTSLHIVKPKLFLLNTKKSPRNVPNGSSKNVDAMSEKNKNLKLPGGKSPWCCCHFKAWPKRAKSLDGGTTETSPERDWAMAALRRSFVLPSG